MHRIQKIRTKLLKQRRFRQLLAASIVACLILGIAVVPIEQTHPDATIKTYGDGLWWSVQTLTTVGYGDVTPITAEGRLLGVLMQMTGAVIFGLLIALISSTMSRSQEEFYWGRLFERLESMEKEIQAIKKSTHYMVKDSDAEARTPQVHDKLS
ncbi:MAG: potassium channel family protein [bacterium]|nr:potassium channel family protein [bacterium]